MINYIKKLLFNKKSNISNTNISAIIFQIDNSNEETKIKIELENLSTDAAQKFGSLLFLINEGYYVKPILDILSEMSKESMEKAIFTQYTMSEWSSKVATNNNTDDDPIIKPTQFNTNHK